MAYTDELVKDTKEVNVIISIGGEYYGIKNPDSGLVIAEENLIVDDPQVNGVNVDIRRANTAVGSFNFKLKDELEYITKKIMLEQNNFLELEVIAYVGFITGSFDFSEYKQIADTRIKSVTKIANGYSIISKEATTLISNPTYNINDKLEIDILPISASLTLQDASLFPDSGLIELNKEFIRYDSKLGNTLLNLTRAVIGVADNHSEGDDVNLVIELVDLNPIDMILQLLLSKNGDNVNHPTYDVLENGLGISPDLIDIAKFEQVKAANFDGDLMRLYMYNETDTLKFIEKEILQPTNARLFSDNGIISITVLDQIEVSAEVKEVNENVIIGTPTWRLTSEKIHNVIKIKYDYEEDTGRFNSTVEFKNQDSIDTFGEKKPLLFNYKGIKTDLGGGAFVSKKAEQLLNRLGTPRGSVTFRAQLDAEDINIGDDVLLNHRFLPQQGGGLGISDQIEVVSRSVDVKKGTCNYKLEYTSFTGIRIPFIAPSPNILSVIDQKTFTVVDGSCFREGHALILWDNDTLSYLPDAVNYVESIEGNTITMVNNFSTDLTGNIRIKLPDYEFCTNDQKSRYAFVGKNTGFFDDGTKSYQIIF